MVKSQKEEKLTKMVFCSISDGVVERTDEALLPSARYERRVGVSLVRAAWERRPEGPAYLLSSVTLLYLAGLCAF